MRRPAGHSDGFAEYRLLAVRIGHGYERSKSRGLFEHFVDATAAVGLRICIVTILGDDASDTLGSNFNTLLAVYTGSSVRALAAVPGGADDDIPGGQSGGPSKATFEVVGGTVHQIAVDVCGASGAGPGVG